MNVFELMAKIGLDTTEYNFGLDAIKNGADEIDMVINIGWVKDKKWEVWVLKH